MPLLSLHIFAHVRKIVELKHLSFTKEMIFNRENIGKETKHYGDTLCLGKELEAKEYTDEETTSCTVLGQ